MARPRTYPPAHLIATLAVALVALLAGADHAQAGKWKVKGAGWGHGIGASQWGTQGFASKKNKSYRWILRHYYRGTKIGQAKTKRIRVLVGSGLGSVSFSGAKKACGRKVSKSKTYSASQSGGRVRLHNSSGKVKKTCGSKLVAKGGRSLTIGRSAYRGKLVVRPSGGSLNAINHVSLDDYVKGVVPNESPSSWDMDALKTQAVTARSYILATGVDGDGFDAYDDTRSQVYGGKATEQSSTNKAVRQTKGEVVYSRGQVAPTFYFSTSGGRTEAIENVWGSSPQAHLKSERDPFDDLSPYHRWKVSYSRAGLQADLGDWVKGKLRKVKILKTGDSPRVVRAKIVGTGGKTVVSGSDIQIRLGLRSTWFRVVKPGSGKKKKKSGSKKSGSNKNGGGSGDGSGGGGSSDGSGGDTGGIGDALPDSGARAGAATSPVPVVPEPQPEP